MRARSLLLVPIASVAIYACSDADVAPESSLPSGPPAGYEDVLIEGLMTSASLQSLAQALADGPPEEGASTRAIIDWPSNGEALAAYPPSPFCWRFGPVAQAAPPARDRWASSAPQELLPRTEPDRAASPLRELLGPPRSAFAEGQPYTGPGTYLVFSTAEDPKLVRALTSRNAFIPTDEVWDKMVAADAPITLTLASASFEQDRVTPYGAVLAGTAITFTIKR